MKIDPANLTWDNMRRGIMATPELLRTLPYKLYEEAQSLTTQEPPAKLYLVGCGDSLYCGMAARYAIEFWSGIPTEAMHALEFSRYAVRTAPANSLVIGISNSGRVTRTVECLVFARQLGLRTLGITYDPESPLAEVSDDVLKYDYQDVGFGPGTLSFAASLLAALFGAVRIGVSSTGGGQISPIEMLSEVVALADPLEATIETCGRLTVEVAAASAELRQITFLGAGPNYGTALFGMAKVIESTGLHVVGQELEEWAHEHFFSTRHGTGTIILSCPGASSERAHEIARGAKAMGSYTVAITSPEDHVLARTVDLVLPVTASDVNELLSPLIYSSPAALLAYEFAQRRGTTMYGFDDGHRQQVNFQQIFGSSSPSSIPSLGGMAGKSR